MYLWAPFHYLHESLQTAEAGWLQPRTIYCFPPGRMRISYGLLWALELGSLEEDNFCKLTKNLYKLVIATR